MTTLMEKESMQSNFGVAFRQAALQALLSIFLAASAWAQPFDLETPADSPTWWTLDPSLAPEALRAALLDPADHRARHEAAVESGRVRAEPEWFYSLLVFFVDPSRNPELISMPLAFIMFSGHECVLLPEGVVAKRLISAGMTESGARAVNESCRNSAERNREISEGNKDRMIEVHDLRRRWFDAKGRNEKSRADLNAAIRTKDVKAFRGISEKGEMEISSLLELAAQNPLIDVAVAALPALQDSLSNRDWMIFRKFLLERTRRLGVIMDVHVSVYRGGSAMNDGPIWDRDWSPQYFSNDLARIQRLLMDGSMYGHQGRLYFSS